MATISDRVIDVVEQITGHSDLKDETNLEDLSLDSLDQVEIVMELEEEFNIAITDNQVERVKTIGDIVQTIENQ